MELIFLEEVGSTNAYVKQHMSELSDCTIVYTSHQSDGRGRLSRKWIDTGENNIYMTFCLKPSCEFQEIYSNLTQYLSVVLCKTLEKYGVDSKIKWPNDVLVDGKKIAGILSETTMQGSSFKGIALGIGVNLNTPQTLLDSIDKPATSLAVILNKEIDREEFLKTLTDEFFLNYNKFLNTGFAMIRDFYLSHASFLNTDISVNVLGKIESGCAVDITQDGALVLEKDNIKNTLLIGDIL